MLSKMHLLYIYSENLLQYMSYLTRD